MKKIFSHKLMVLLTISVIIVSGCVSQQPAQTQAFCGNKIVETGEECDGSACPSGKACSTNCKCEIASPPPIPE